MVAPGLFEPFDDHGHVRYKGGSLEDSDEQAVELGDRAIAECPEQALSWKEVAG
jgi:ferredoxin